MLRFSFARFSSFAFCRTLLCYSSCWLSPFLFRVLFCFYRFRLYLFLPAFGCFSLWLVYLRFFGFFVIVLLRLCTPGFFVSFVSFAIVSFAFAFSARFVQSLAFFISGLCYFSWRSVYLGSARLALRGPRIVGLFVLVPSVCCS